MFNIGRNWRLPRVRISLRTFLLLAAISGPVVACINWRCLADEVRSASRSVATGDQQVPRAVLNVVFRRSRFGTRREVLYVIVRTLAPVSEVELGTEPSDTAPS